MKQLLPTSAASEEAKELPSSATPRMRFYVVLVVDDDPNFVSLLTETLSHESFSTVTATSAIGSLVVYSNLPRVDVVLIDVYLLDIRGDELAAKLRDLGYAGPVLYMSASAPPKGLCPPSDFFFKPLDKAKLLRRLHELLGGTFEIVPA